MDDIEKVRNLLLSSDISWNYKISGCILNLQLSCANRQSALQ